MTLTELQQHVSRVHLSQSDKERARLGIGVLDCALQTGILTSESLDFLFGLATDSQDKIAFIAMEILISLSQKFSEIFDAWRKLAGSPRAQHRIRAVIFLYDQRIPMSFAEEILSHAISDRSKKVKAFALETVRSRGVKSLRGAVKDQLPKLMSSP